MDDNKERYNFTWNGKGQAIKLSQTPSMGTLRPYPGEEESKNWDTTENLYIEGDNLEVLKLLQKSYYGKVKMIYIDPPYNTGKDFIYPDDYSDSIKNYKQITGQYDENGNQCTTNAETSGRYHTSWLNMMYPRLRISKTLLADNGLIFITLDDHENATARMICNEIFGESNFITEFIWEKKKKPSFLHRNVGKLFDYVLCYAKNAEITNPFSVEKTTEGKKYPFNNAGNGKTTLLFPPCSVQFACDDGYIPAQDMSEGNIVTVLKKDLHIVNHTNANELILEGEWRYSQQKLDEIIKDGEKIVISKVPFRPNHIKSGGEIKKMKNMLSTTHYSCETNEDGTAQISQLFDNNQMVFDTPKPVGLLKILISGITYEEKNSVVLDFFSGSATTAHAVMQLNAEDGGNRRFIMVQLPEPCAEKTEAYKAGYQNICEIGKERIRRAGEKIKQEIEAENAQLKTGEDPKKVPDIGFKVFKLDSSNLKKWQPDYDDFNQSLLDSIDNYVDGRTELDVVYEIMLKMGLELTYPLETCAVKEKNIYVIAYGALMICLDNEITTDVAHEMIRLHEEYQPEIWQVVFKDNGFASDSVKTNIKEMLKVAGLDEDAFTTI